MDVNEMMAQAVKAAKEELGKVSKWDLAETIQGWAMYRGRTEKASFVLCVGPELGQADGTCTMQSTVLHLSRELAEEAAQRLRGN